MHKPKATSREKAMDEAIAQTRRPYDYRITKQKLDEAAKNSHEHFNNLRLKQKEEADKSFNK
ncbi:MAG: hypothetical protein ABRQ26_11080 [Syntrophomonadaceae bacterium]